MSHLCFTAFIISTNNQVPLLCVDRVFYATAFTFDVSCELVWCPLVAGAVLCIVSPDIMLSPQDFQLFITASSITFMDLVPSLLMFSLEVWTTKLLPATLHTLHSIGEECRPQLANRILHIPELKFINTYGPAETQTVAHYKVNNLIQESTPIGKPIPNVTAYILSQKVIPSVVGIGIPGELAMGGVQQACGYIGRPDQTNKSFVQLQDSATSWVKLYRTGDRAMMLASGDIKFMGRLDFQIKLNGQRIETAEIESVLQQTEGISEALVTIEHAQLVRFAHVFDPSYVCLIGCIRGSRACQPKQGLRYM